MKLLVPVKRVINYNVKPHIEGLRDVRGNLFPLADKLGAAVGASRAAVDAGYVPND